MVHEDITDRILHSAFKVHSALGAGLLESTYDARLQHQFRLDGLHFEHQVRLPVLYQGLELEAGYRIDFLVESCVIVKLKAVEKLLPVHLAQILSYLNSATGK